LGLGAKDPHFSLIEHTGVLDDEFYLRLDADVARCSVTARRRPRRTFTSAILKSRRAARLHEALYETSKYMLYHNPPDPMLRRRSVGSDCAKARWASLVALALAFAGLYVRALTRRRPARLRGANRSARRVQSGAAL